MAAPGQLAASGRTAAHKNKKWVEGAGRAAGARRASIGRRAEQPAPPDRGFEAGAGATGEYPSTSSPPAPRNPRFCTGDLFCIFFKDF